MYTALSILIWLLLVAAIETVLTSHGIGEDGRCSRATDCRTPPAGTSRSTTGNGRPPRPDCQATPENAQAEIDAIFEH